MFESLLSTLFQPKVPKATGILSGGLTSLYGGLTIDQQNRLNKLAKMNQDTLTSGQRNKLDALTAKKDGVGMLQQTLDAQGKLLPQLQANQMQSLNGLTPQLAALQYNTQAQYAPQYAALAQGIEQSLAPQYFSTRDSLGSSIAGKIGQGLTPGDLGFFADQQRNAQAARGMFDSPLGGAMEAKYLTGLNLQQQQQNLLNAQNFLNSYKLPQVADATGSLNAAMGMTPNLAGGAFTPLGLSDTTGLSSNLAGMKYAQGMANAQAYGGALGQGLNLAAGAAMGGMGMGGMGGMGGVGGTASGWAGAGQGLASGLMGLMNSSKY